MTTLFQINDELAVLLNKLADHDTGEISPEIEAQINALETVKTQKLVGCRNYYQQIEGQIDMAMAEAARITKYAQHLKAIQEAIKRILIANIPEGQKITDDAGRVVVSWRKCPASIVIDDYQKAMDYCMQHLPEAVETPAPQLSKSVLKDALKDSAAQIDGIRVVDNRQNIQIK